MKQPAFSRYRRRSAQGLGESVEERGAAAAPAESGLFQAQLLEQDLANARTACCSPAGAA
ncbi:hypothetical protein [Streptomyces sasae]|uniref:hypothetical protein n=1 Tax=Streptomyces sasae TaxID=1266772 RepID=UPI00292DBA72|nr:hypothetical protein [Streptomyces sasae]